MIRKKNKLPVLGRPLPGYPKNQPFTSMKDVTAYLSGDTITCLLCGRSFILLSNHIASSHKISADHYRLQFGVPLTYSLLGKAHRDAQRRHARKLIKQGILPQGSRERVQKAIEAAKRRRPTPNATRRESRTRLLRLHRRQKPLEAADFEEFLRRCQMGRAPFEVGADKDMPTKKTFQRYTKNNPSFKERYDRIWEAQPFAVQVRANKTGERYRRTLVKLRLNGKSWREVGREMGVDPNTVKSMWHQLKVKRQLKKYRSA